MPFRTPPDARTEYGLVSFDARGEERRDDPDGVMSERLIARAASGAITNIFLFVHGWMGDVRSAQQQFDAWITALDSHAADRARAAAIFPGFTPLYIGIHWPSLPWGDESIGASSFSTDDAASPQAEVDRYLAFFDDGPGIRDAVAAIVNGSQTGGAADPGVQAAFAMLDAAVGASGGPDADGIPFDAGAAGRGGGDAFGATGGEGLLASLRLLSYWSMKKRARTIGEGAVHDLLRALQHATAARATPIHLIGHSFGSVVISSALRGPQTDSALDRPIDSVALIQGAVSLWSYAATIPDQEGAGYFADVIGRRKVRGPIITTRSRHDAAVNNPYRLASRVSRDASFGAGDFYPRFGAVGRFGLQGLPEPLVVDCPMAASTDRCGFECGKVYNLEASAFIARMDGASGAHNDVSGPEVAHAIWEAAFASART